MFFFIQPRFKHASPVFCRRLNGILSKLKERTKKIDPVITNRKKFLCFFSLDAILKRRCLLKRVRVNEEEEELNKLYEDRT